MTREEKLLQIMEQTRLVLSVVENEKEALRIIVKAVIEAFDFLKEAA